MNELFAYAVDIFWEEGGGVDAKIFSDRCVRIFDVLLGTLHIVFVSFVSFFSSLQMLGLEKGAT
jgi:hypothetical protein